MVTRAKTGIHKPKVLLLNSSHTALPEPHSVSKALTQPEWKTAMQLEYDAILHNNTWTLVPHTSDIQSITTKWLFRVKYNKDGTVERYKALVARGFQQQAGVDYFHTFSPVIKPVT